MRRKDHVEQDLNRQVQAIIDLARLVTVFDGTDRHSLDLLRDALYRFGQLKEEWEALHD